MNHSDGHSHRWELKVPWPHRGVNRIYDLSHELATGMPHHPNHPPYSFALTKVHGEYIMGEGVSNAAEMITTGGHVGTHVDGLGHISKGGLVYGGHRIREAQSYVAGVGYNSIHELAPLIGQGHLVDGPKLFGRNLTPQDGIGAEHLDKWFQERPMPTAGSIVCVRTGWAAYWGDNRKYLGRDTGLPGVNISGARWLSERGIRATGGDTVDYNQFPDARFEVHSYLLVERGIPIMEMLNLEALAADAVYEFLFIAIPLPIRGGTGSPIRPLALI